MRKRIGRSLDDVLESYKDHGEEQLTLARDYVVGLPAKGTRDATLKSALADHWHAAECYHAEQDNARRRGLVPKLLPRDRASLLALYKSIDNDLENNAQWCDAIEETIRHWSSFNDGVRAGFPFPDVQALYRNPRAWANWLE